MKATLINGANDFNPLPSCEGRLYLHAPFGDGTYFNPLPSCEGRLTVHTPILLTTSFQSTPLMRGETYKGLAPKKRKEISIHSPHARGD